MRMTDRRPLEAKIVDEAAALLDGFCTHVGREYQIPGHPYRVDLCGHLPNGHWALIECKRFDPQTLSEYVDAIDQAASYAEAIEYPVFIGPVVGQPVSLATGRADNALGALHLLASRLNVGFLWKHPAHGNGGLLLRGQNLLSRDGPHKNFDRIWRYTRRAGSKRG